MTTGEGDLDLNCETAAVVEEKEVVGEAKGLKGAQRAVGGELGEGLGSDAGGLVEKECDRGLAGGEDEMVGKQDGGAAAELGEGSEEDGQMKSIGWERGEVVNWREGLERVMGKDDDSVAVLVGGGGFDDEKLEESSLLDKELTEINHGPAAECVQTAYAELAQLTRRSEVEFDGGKFLGANSTENGETFPVFSYDFGNSESNSQAMDMEDRHGGEQTQQNDVNEDEFRADSESVATTVSIGGSKNQTLERSMMLDKKECKTQAQSLDRCAQVEGSETEAGKRKAQTDLHDGNLLVLNEEEEALVHLVAILDEDFDIQACTRSMESGDIQRGETDVESVFRKDEDIAAGSNSEKLFNTNMAGNENAELVSFSTQGFEAFEASSPRMVFQGQIDDDKMGGTDLDAEAVVGTNKGSVNVSASSGVPDKERGKISALLVGQLTVVEGTRGSVCVNDFCESNNIEGSVIDAVSYSGQVQKAIVSDHHGRGFHSEAADMLERKREASITISIDGVSKDEILESSCISEGNLAVTKEDDNESALTEKRVAKPEESEGVWFDMARLTGNAEGTVYHMDVHSPEFEEGIAGNQKVISCVLGVVAVDCEEAEVQLTEASHRSDSVQEEAEHDFDVTEMTEKSPLSLESDGTVKNRRVCDFVVGHPAHREGEIVGNTCHSQAEVRDDFNAGQVRMIEKGFTGPQESVEVASSAMDHALGLEASQGALSESMVEATGIDSTQEEPIMVNQKIYGEHNALAGESLHMNSVPISGVQSLGSQQLDTVITGNAKTPVGLDEVTNMGASSADMHNSDEIIVKDKDILRTDGGSSMYFTLQKLQNLGAKLIFDVNSCQDSSSVMISSSVEVEHAIGTDSVGAILVEKADPIDENFNSSLAMMSDFATESQNPSVHSLGNEPSAASTVLQPSVAFIGHELVKESETEQCFTASEFSVSAVCKNIDSNQSMHSGQRETLKEPESQIEESSDSRTGFTSTSQQATYYLSVPLKEGFSTSELVWGKVKSHPWWPGQIIDLSGASELALKYQKKDHFLVAYFGDKTFAWCEETHLKPFQLHFQQMEKQSNSDSFLRAISDILVEISRRIELAMACFCLPGETPAEVKYQKLENAGVRGKTVNSVINRVEIVTYFHPDRLLDYLKILALLPTEGADRLELVVAQGQLKSFYRSKGYTDLPVFTNGSGLVDNDCEAPLSTREKPNEDDLENSSTLSDLFSTKGKSIGKQKHIVEDGRKQKCLSDLMEENTPVLLENGGGTIYGLVDDGGCISSDKKRKFVDSCSTDIWGSKTKKLDTQVDKENKLSPTNSTISFKVGEFISRAASKLTSGQPIRKCYSETSERSPALTDDWRIDDMYVEDFLDIPFDTPKVQIDISVDYPSTNEMLSQLCSAARNPMKGCNLLSVLISFFTAFRNLRISNFSIEKINIEKPRAKRGRKKKINSVLASPDTSTPDHMKDSYWSDMIFPEKDALVNIPKRRGRKRKSAGEPASLSLLNLQSGCETKLPMGTICPHVKHVMAAERPIVSVEEKIVDERTPTAVIMHFNNSNSLPSETDLIRIFSRYGPLKEAETYIDRNTCSAKVVFKKRADAEIAFSSAGKLRTFGSALVSYRLRHFPFKPSPVKIEVELESKPSTGEALGEPSSTSVQPQEHTETLSDISPHEDAVKELSGFIITDVDDGTHSVESQECEIGEECFDIDSRSPVENDVDIVLAQVEDVDMGPSYFVQCHGDDGNTLGRTKSGIDFSEFVQSQVTNANSEPKSAETARKKSNEDVTVQQETSAVSDHLLIESSDQYLSYSDIYQAESAVDSDIMQVDTINQDSSNRLNQAEAGEASNVVQLNSVHKGSCGSDTVSNAETMVPSSCSFVAEHLEDGTFLQKSHDLGGVVGDDSCISATSVEVRDLLEAAQGQNGEQSCPNSAAALVGTQTSVENSQNLQSEKKDVAIAVVGRAFQGTNMKLADSSLAESNAPVVDGKGTGLPSCTAEFVPQERSSTVVHTVLEGDSSSDLSQARSLSKGVAVGSRVEVIGDVPSEFVEADTQLGSLSEATESSI